MNILDKVKLKEKERLFAPIPKRDYKLNFIPKTPSTIEEVKLEKKEEKRGDKENAITIIDFDNAKKYLIKIYFYLQKINSVNSQETFLKRVLMKIQKMKKIKDFQ